MDHSPAKFVLLLMAAAATWSSVFPVADAQSAHAIAAGCIPRERDALLAFKQGINDTEDDLVSWQEGNQDCCRWKGITCDNATGHVVELDLGIWTSFLADQISPSLLSLERLESLNLQYAGLCDDAHRLPEFLGSFKNLTHLALFGMLCHGEAPPHLGNLSKLEHLVLSAPALGQGRNLKDISWLTRLPLLSYLDLSYLDLSSVVDWPLVVSMIPSLEYLGLSNCSLPSAARSLPHLNTTNLKHLDLSRNYFGHPVASCWFWNITSLEYLDLSNTTLYGPFPGALGHMTSLQWLDLSNMGNSPTMTVELGNLCDLGTLRLDRSLSSGNITDFLEKLPKCSSNRLQELTLKSNNMVGKLINSMGQLNNLTMLDLSHNNITGTIPLGIDKCSYLWHYDLSYNHLTGAIPSWLGNCTRLCSSHNSFSGPLPLHFGSRWLAELSLSYSYFSGPISKYICQLEFLLVLELSYNFLEGELPHCSRKSSLVYLLLSNNNFSGKFPSSVRNYSRLAFLDLSRNNFYGTLPSWIGELVNLKYLQLSHNLLHGDIPPNVTNLYCLRHLNLARNSISGVIPSSLSKLTAMTQANSTKHGSDKSCTSNNYGAMKKEIWLVVMKRQELKYGTGFFDVLSIDLSLNKLVGRIPDELTSLNGLLNLNLSWNHLSGQIPAEIGAMKSIESLDLSRNNLYDEIPTSLSNLTYLSSLDLSYNNLTGRIPLGNQLDTIYSENPSIYAGNIGLCGPPLERNCSGNNGLEHMNQQTSEKVYEPLLSLYFGLGSGFVAGLWVVFCSLLFNKTWRVSYFRLFDKLYDNAYVFVVVTWGMINDKETTS
nr:receptor-like protein EIX1 [Aegilops tauschii subsp. strangulata]